MLLGGKQGVQKPANQPQKLQEAGVQNGNSEVLVVHGEVPEVHVPQVQYQGCNTELPF